MDSVHQSNRHDSLLLDSPVNLSNTQVNKQGLRAEDSQRSVNSINRSPQVVGYKGGHVVAPPFPTQPQNTARSLPFKIYGSQK
jgi:hypothetical protein